MPLRCFSLRITHHALRCLLTPVLCVELTLFQHHCQKNRAEIETIAEAARLAMEFGSIFPLTSRCYRLIQTAPMTSAASERSFSKSKLIRQ